jgi:hypothetical protein
MSDWLEHQLNKRFEGMEHPFDAEAAWQQLEDRRKKRKRGFAWWWYTGGALLVLLLLGSWALFIQLEKQPESQLNPKNQVITPSLAAPVAAGSDKQKTQSAVFQQPKMTNLLPTSPQQDVFRKRISSQVLEPTLLPEVHAPTPQIIEDIDFLPSPDFVVESSSVLPLLQSIPPKALPGLGSPHSKSSSTPNAWLFAGGYGITQSTTTGALPALASIDGIDHWQTELNYRYFLTDQLWISTGVAYRQFTTRVNAQDTSFRAETQEDQLIQVIQYPDGTSEEIYGPLDVMVREITQRQHWQQHSSLELQLLAGYQADLGTRWHWSFGTGISWGYVLSRQGIGQNPLNPSSWQDLRTLSYRNTTPFRWIGVTDLSFQWSETWGFFLGVQGGWDLSNQWQASSPDIQGGMDQRFKWATGTIGLRFHGF